MSFRTNANVACNKQEAKTHLVKSMGHRLRQSVQKKYNYNYAVHDYNFYIVLSMQM